MRLNDRKPDEIRPCSFVRSYSKFAEGSALVRLGDTEVLCTASVEERVPFWMKNSGKGWVTAEYSMLPRATARRQPRELMRGKVGGRSHEIQRLIGRALRAIIDLDRLGERTIWIDCDVLQADGGTRTAAISGAYVALYDALRTLIDQGKLAELPLSDQLAAVSVGILEDQLFLDLDYEEDSAAAVDMNLAMTASGKVVEIQASAERHPFTLEQLSGMRDLAVAGIQKILSLQLEAIAGTSQ